MNVQQIQFPGDSRAASCRVAVNSRRLLQRLELDACNQQRTDQFPVVVAVVKEEEKSRLGNMCKIGMRHTQLAPVCEIDCEGTKRSFTKKSTYLFKHSWTIPKLGAEASNGQLQRILS